MDRLLNVKRAVAEVLDRPDLNGIYRISLADIGFTPALDGRELTSKQALLAGIGRVLNFPDYYGGNWDALEECVSDMSWLEGPICLLIDHANAIPLPELKPLLAIFSQQAAEWGSHGRVCSLFLCGLDTIPHGVEIRLLA